MRKRRILTFDTGATNSKPAYSIEVEHMHVLLLVSVQDVL